MSQPRFTGTRDYIADEDLLTAVNAKLIVSPLALVNALAQAKANNIPVIAYDRLLMDTDSVSYYATFDNKGVGTLIGKYVEKKDRKSTRLNSSHT